MDEDYTDADVSAYLINGDDSVDETSEIALAKLQREFYANSIDSLDILSTGRYAIGSYQNWKNSDLYNWSSIVMKKTPLVDDKIIFPYVPKDDTDGSVGASIASNLYTYYTRDGSFKVDPQGYLVTNSGEYVMGTNTQTGNSERIYVGTDLISISPDNSVMINGENKYKFNIVDFENYDNLTKYGNNLYKGEGGFNSNNYSIKQKYLEGSNVDSTNEIAMMMETVNEFEANQKVIQTIDSILGQIASDIGRVK